MITKINIGDVFCSKVSAEIIILQKEWVGFVEKSKYVMAGNGGLILWSNSDISSLDGVLNFLNKHNYILMGNINDKIIKTLEFYKNKFKEDNKIKNFHQAIAQEDLNNNIEINKKPVIPEGWTELEDDDIISNNNRYWNKNCWTLASGSVGKIHKEAKLQYYYVCENIVWIK